MKAPLFSIITVTYNSATTLGRTMDSVLRQSLQDFEYLIVDGGSRDGTLDVVESRASDRIRWSSGPDRGTYDAMAKGIANARGRYIGILNSDDVFAGADILAAVRDAFSDRDDVVVYGDIEYFNLAGAVTRTWVAGPYLASRWRRGWHPPHPSVFIPASLYRRFGSYDPDYRLAADYKLLLRLGLRENVPFVYVPKILARMQRGGQSTSGIGSIVRGNLECLRAWRDLGIRAPLSLIPLKLWYKLAADRPGFHDA